jgi:hypothetical protein
MIGNKCSGTSHFVKVINHHPHVFIAPEADLVWALFCRRAGRPVVAYRDDGGVGLQRTMAAFGPLVMAEAAPQEKFQSIISDMARKAGKRPEALAWLGDKKPVQQADPLIFDYALEQWPTARFIHLVRHPQAVVASMMRRSEKMPQMQVWKRPARDLLEFWVRNERWVLEHKRAGRAPVLSIRFQDLTDAPAATWSKTAAFLELDVEDMLDAAAKLTRPGQDAKYVEPRTPLTSEAAELVELYGL